MSNLYHLERNLQVLWSDQAAPGTPVLLKSTPNRLYYGHDKLGLWVKVAGTAAKLKFTVQVAGDEADGDYISLTGSPLITTTAAGVYFANLPMVNMALLRILVTDDTGNGANTVITSAKLYIPDLG